MNDGIAGGLFFNSTSRARQFGGEMKRFMGRAVGFHAVALHKLSCAAQREMLKSIFVDCLLVLPYFQAVDFAMLRDRCGKLAV